MAMLNLPQNRRVNRQWQRDFFSKVGLDLEKQSLKGLRSNSLDLQGIRRIPPQPLKTELLSKFFESEYLDWVNNAINPGFFDDMYCYINSLPKVGGVLRRLKLCPITLEAYAAYVCLKPIGMAVGRKH